MSTVWVKIFSVFLVSISIGSCTNKNKLTKENDDFIKITELKYAEGFEIQHYKNYKKLIVKSPYQNASQSFSFILAKDNSVKSDIEIPIKKVVVTSTTHIPMLEALGVEKSLVGFPSLNFISSEKTRKLIAENKITDVGHPESMNVETLLNLNPNAVIGFSISSNNELGDILEKMNIPFIYNGDWLEKTPLGRTEWIKFFGVLFDKEQEADSIFNIIENNYLEAKKIAAKAPTKPTILAGGIYKDVWYLPAGNSFEAQLLQDANTNYLWKSSTGTGSLSLNLENVFEKAQNADFWFSPGFYKNLDDLKSANSISTQLKAFQQQKVYSHSNMQGETGGIIYFELSPTRPDLVLKDLIKITHPNLLPNYSLTFYQQLK